jgi:hypothetical protein
MWTTDEIIDAFQPPIDQWTDDGLDGKEIMRALSDILQGAGWIWTSRVINYNSLADGSFRREEKRDLNSLVRSKLLPHMGASGEVLALRYHDDAITLTSVEMGSKHILFDAIHTDDSQYTVEVSEWDYTDGERDDVFQSNVVEVAALYALGIDTYENRQYREGVMKVIQQHIAIESSQDRPTIGKYTDYFISGNTKFVIFQPSNMDWPEEIMNALIKGLSDTKV